MSIPVGVIGIGTMGEHHVRNYSAMDQADLIGIYDVNLKKAQRVAKTFNTIAYEDLGKLLSKIKAASICVPTPSHKQIANEAFSKGVDVLLEKPICLKIEDANEIIKNAEKHNARLMIGHVERFNPAILTLKEVIDKSSVIYIECQRLGPYDSARQNVGVTLDLMIHDIDVILDLVGSEVIESSCLVGKVMTETEDIAHAQLIFKNGIVAVFTASRISQKRVRILNVTQKDSYITADYQTQEVFIRSGLSSKYIGGHNVSYKQVGAIEIPYVQRGEPLKNELEHFVHAVEHKEPFVVTGLDGKKSLATTLDLVNKATCFSKS